MSTNEPPLYRWVVATLVFVAGFVSIGWIWFALPVLLPRIGRELNLAAWQTQLIFSAIPLTFIVTALTGGMLGDRYSLKWVIGLGLLLMAAAAWLRAGLSGYPGALAASLLTGVGVGLTVPSYVNVLMRWFPPTELGVANGLRLAGVRGGAAVAQGFVVGYLLMHMGGWRPAQVVLGGAGFAVAILWLVAYRDAPGRARHSPRRSEPESLRMLFGRRELQVLGGMTFLHLFSFMAYLGLLPTWLHRLEGGLGLPILSDRLGRRKTILLPALLLMITGIAGTGLAGGGLPLGIAIALTGIGGGAMLPLLLTVVSEHPGSESAGGPAGLLLSFGQIGAATGPPLGGLVLERGGVTPSALMLVAPLALGTLLLYRVRETGPGVG